MNSGGGELGAVSPGCPGPGCPACPGCPGNPGKLGGGKNDIILSLLNGWAKTLYVEAEKSEWAFRRFFTMFRGG